MDDWIGKPFLLSVNGVECWWIFECIYCLATLDLVLCVSYSRCVGSFQISCAVVWLARMLVVGIIGFFSQLTLCVIFGACEQNGTLGHYKRMDYFLMHSEPVWCNDSWFIWSCTFKHFHGLLFTMPAHSISANPLLTYTHTHTFIFERLLLGFCRLGIFS